MNILIRSLLAMLLAWASLSGVRAQESVLIPGATIQIRLGGVPPEDVNQVSGPYTVSSSGTLNLMHLKGEIKAAGLRPTDLALRITAAYKAAEIYTNPNVVVLAAGKDPGGDMVITVGGEVRQPRAVPYRPGLDLYGAIVDAGGPSEFGDMKRVKLIRNKQERIVDLRKVTSENSIELIAGDKVVVPGG